MSDSQDKELETPKRIGPYKVLRAIARGGMAAVYEVLDRDTGERYALKLLTQRGLARPRFDREYRALTRLDHPNILRVYRYGFSEDKRPYLTMELLDGVAAQVHAKSCGRPGTPRRTAEVVRIVTHVADALDYLHQRGIVHRDLKSSNVMVLPDGRVKLLDFGTARMRGAVEEITLKGEFVGTFAYASPEQLQGREVDARADIYSLGVLFYRLLTGKRPFEADSPHALAMLHIEQDPRPPDELAPGLPAPLVELVQHMLAKAADQRPRSAKEVADRLRAYVRSKGGGSRPASPLPPTLVGRGDALAAVRSTIEKGRPGRMVLLVAPPGSGRRRLLEQAALDAHRKGRRVYRGHFPGTSALGPLHDLVRRALRGLPDPPEGHPELERLDNIPRGTLPAPGETVRICQAVASAFLRRADHDGRKIVLCLGDLHRAPPLALQALRTLRAHADEQQISIIILASTVGEADRPGSLMRRQFPDAVRLELRPLTPKEVGRLVGSMLGRTPPPPELALRIHDATGGLPGYVEEVVRAMAQEGLVEGRQAADAGVEWVDRSDGRIAIPSSAREAISLRLSALSGTARRLVASLALAGGNADSDLLAHAADLPLDKAREQLAALEEDGLLALRDEHRWAFRLGLTADLVEESLRPTRRLVVQRRLAERLQDAEPSPAKVRVMLAAGQLHQALVDAVAWARPELAQPQPREVLPLLTRVNEALPEAGDLPPSQLARFYLCLAQAMAGNDPSDPRIDGYLDRARALASGWSRKAEVHLARAHVGRLRGSSAAERANVSRARGLLDHVADPYLRERVHKAAGRRALADGRFDDALASFREAQHAAEQAGDLRGAAQARSRAGVVRYALGELEAAERTLKGAANALQRLDDLGNQWMNAARLSEVLLIQARFSEALDLLLPDLDRVRTVAPPAVQARVLIHLSLVLHEMMRLGEAREHIAQLRAIDRATLSPPQRAASTLVQARVLIASDEPLGAIELLEPARDEASRSEQPIEEALLLAWHGVAAAAAGDQHRADDETRRAVTMLRQERHVPALAMACRCRAEVATGREDPDQIFRPVLRWVEARPARLLRMAWLLARVDHAVARGDLRQALISVDRAKRLLDDIGNKQNAADRSALKVHPWAQRIRRYQGELEEV